MKDPSAWIVIMMVIRWASWSVQWWRGALPQSAVRGEAGDGGAARQPGAAARVTIEPDGTLVLRIDAAGAPGCIGGIPMESSQ